MSITNKELMIELMEEQLQSYLRYDVNPWKDIEHRIFYNAYRAWSDNEYVMSNGSMVLYGVYNEFHDDLLKIRKLK